MKSPLLNVENLEVKYFTREGVLTAIRNINFDVYPGEIVGVVGESGCGKSTVASALMRLLPSNGKISNGRILLNGQDIAALDMEQMRQYLGRDLAMIFQDAMTSLNPVFQIEPQMIDAQMAHIPSKARKNRKELRDRAIEMLDRVGIPDANRRINDYPHQFSGGMRQRIMIAIALLSSPGLLIADEPTSALDVTLEAQILDLILNLRDEFNTSMVYITHDLGLISQICDRVIVMYAGNIVESGDVYKLFENPRHPYTKTLLRAHPSHRMRTHYLRTIPGLVPSLRDLPVGCKFSPRCELAKKICHIKEPEYWKLGEQSALCNIYSPDWNGRSVDSLKDFAPDDGNSKRITPRSWREEKMLIQTVDLHMNFKEEVGLIGQIFGEKTGWVKAVSGVNIEIRRGETLGLVGESGSGKTTLARTILRLTNPSKGSVIVNGKDISNLSQEEIRPLRSEMQMIFQDPFSSLNPRMKVSSLLLEPFRIHKKSVSGKEKVVELLSMVGLASEQADKYPHQLSGGQARRVGIARALALEPDILLADEPTAGLDVSVAAGILNLLKDLRDKLQLTYVIITHDMNVIGYISDRVAVMYLGRIVELANTEDLFSQPSHPYTEALISAIPVPDPQFRGDGKRILLSGEIPSPRNPPSGCVFHPRCTYMEDRCRIEEPLLRLLDNSEHWVACHFPEKVQNGLKNT
jgi:oligopeptide/dipeptide ABC transporter ATP-binding protein